MTSRSSPSATVRVSKDEYRRAAHQLTLQFLHAFDDDDDDGSMLPDATSPIRQKDQQPLSPKEVIPLSTLAAQFQDDLEKTASIPRTEDKNHKLLPYCRGCGCGNTADDEGSPAVSPVSLAYPYHPHLTLRVEPCSRKRSQDKLSRTQKRRHQRQSKQRERLGLGSTMPTSTSMRNERVVACRQCGLVLIRYPGTVLTKQTKEKKSSRSHQATAARRKYVQQQQQQQNDSGFVLLQPNPSSLATKESPQTNPKKKDKKQKGQNTLSQQGRRRKRKKNTDLSTFLTSLHDR